MADGSVQSSPKQTCCCSRSGIIKDPICVQCCDNVSMMWVKGGELFRCEPCEDALIAYDKAGETWPWVRSLKIGNKAAVNHTTDAPQGNQFMKHLVKLISWLY